MMFPIPDIQWEILQDRKGKQGNPAGQGKGDRAKKKSVLQVL